MSRATGALVAVGMIGGTAAAAPYWFGARIESRFEEGIASAPANPYYHLEIEKYDRGWLTAEAVTVLKFTPPDKEPVTLRFDHRIEHGPILGGLRQARITTTAALSPEIAALIGPLFGAQPPLVSVIDIALSGEPEGTIDSPAASAKVGDGGALDVAWQGLRSHFHADRGMTAIDFAGELPGLAFGPSGGPPLIQFEGFAMEGTATRSETGLWLSRSTLDLAQFTATDLTSGAMTRVKNVRATSSSDEKDGLIQVALGLAVAEATSHVDGDTVKDFALDFSLHDLDAAAMKKFQESMEANRAQAGRSDEQMGQVVLAQMQSLAGELLARKPSFAIDRLSFVYQNEPFTATARVQYVGAGNLAAWSPMRDLAGGLGFEAPQSTVQRLVETQQLNALRQQRAKRMIEAGLVSEPTPEEVAEMEAQAKAISGPMIQDLIAQQMLVPAGGDRIRAEAAIENGRITLNGRPFPPAMPPGGVVPNPCRPYERGAR
ncbi:MAG: DUF945 domain-containing protein [Candidatus Eisenbacteria bacterium]|uniref:DUF945 domain-containing protein n=1 Tax=Eiseniibacteriota bacterium TaxID=2212470 RepID=A0A538UAU8_UNCEI|nr:MAG: DUF945 domain-containing protein [Candidatus Eisenbacteria bacterium]